MRSTRRSFLQTSAGIAATVATGQGRNGSPIPTTTAANASRWVMPAEDSRHDRTWMCWPSSSGIWGSDLRDVQDTIGEIALAISQFEPVAILARPSESGRLRKRLKRVAVLEAPVDDLWARDTLPNFLIRRASAPTSNGLLRLGASHAVFNGWGNKQTHSGDSQLAALVAKQLGIGLIDSGLVGEGGGIEVDGAGTVLAAESCWVNSNRNKQRTRAEVQKSILLMLGADRLIWVDGLAGHDITDGHIDTLARFVNPITILLDMPAYDDPQDPWVRVAARTRQQVGLARTAAGKPYTVVDIVQPKQVRRNGNDFLSTYMNYYVCNGAVISPQFGDKAADTAALAVLQRLFPDRVIVQLNIDALGAGGGGIHCATQQQPSMKST